MRASAYLKGNYADRFPFGGEGVFLKGNLHTHTTVTDGPLDPEETIRRYKAAGYDFLCADRSLLSIRRFPIRAGWRFCPASKHQLRRQRSLSVRSSGRHRGDQNGGFAHGEEVKPVPDSSELERAENDRPSARDGAFRHLRPSALVASRRGAHRRAARHRRDGDLQHLLRRALCLRLFRSDLRRCPHAGAKSSPRCPRTTRTPPNASAAAGSASRRGKTAVAAIWKRCARGGSTPPTGRRSSIIR